MAEGYENFITPNPTGNILEGYWMYGINLHGIGNQIWVPFDLDGNISISTAQFYANNAWHDLTFLTKTILPFQKFLRFSSEDSIPAPGVYLVRLTGSFTR